MLIQIKGREIKGTLKEVVVTNTALPLFEGKQEFSWTATLDEPTHKPIIPMGKPIPKEENIQPCKTPRRPRYNP
jgi:hypothetical protein